MTFYGRVTTTTFKPFSEDKEGVKTLWHTLQHRKKLHKAGHGDSVIVICGGEQIGKSTFMTRLGYGLFKEEIFKDGKINTDNIVFNGFDFRDRAVTLTSSFIHDDEAGTHFYSREAMTKETVECIKTLKLCGFKHNFIFLLIPDFFSIDTYIRTHRVRCIIRILPDRKFKAYSFFKKQNKLYKINNEKSFRFVRPSAVGYWPATDTDPDYLAYLEAYRKLEKTSKTKELSVRREYNKEEEKQKDPKKEIVAKLYSSGNFTQEQLAEAVGVTRQTIINWLKGLSKT